jgi:hypothetical protein
MPTRFSLAQVETAKQNLDALPAADKDTREVGLQGAIKALAPTIRKLASRGYSRQKIIELLREQGLPIRSSTLKHYLGEKRTRREAPSRAPSSSRAGDPAVGAGGRGAEVRPEPRPTSGQPVAISAARETASSRLNSGPAKSASPPRP